MDEEERQHFLPLGHLWIGLRSDEVDVDAVDPRLEVASHIVQSLLSALLPIVLLQPVFADLHVQTWAMNSLYPIYFITE